MIRVGQRVRIIKGKYKGKTGVIVNFLGGTAPEELKPGIDINGEIVVYIWQIQLDYENRFWFAEKDFELINE